MQVFQQLKPKTVSERLDQILVLLAGGSTALSAHQLHSAMFPARMEFRKELAAVTAAAAAATGGGGGDGAAAAGAVVNGLIEENADLAENIHPSADDDGNSGGGVLRNPDLEVFLSPIKSPAPVVAGRVAYLLQAQLPTSPTVLNPESLPLASKYIDKQVLGQNSAATTLPVAAMPIVQQMGATLEGQRAANDTLAELYYQQQAIERQIQQEQARIAMQSSMFAAGGGVASVTAGAAVVAAAGIPLSNAPVMVQPFISGLEGIVATQHLQQVPEIYAGLPYQQQVQHTMHHLGTMGAFDFNAPYSSLQTVQNAGILRSPYRPAIPPVRPLVIYPNNASVRSLQFSDAAAVPYGGNIGTFQASGGTIASVAPESAQYNDASGVLFHGGVNSGLKLAGAKPATAKGAKRAAKYAKDLSSDPVSIPSWTEHNSLANCIDWCFQPRPGFGKSPVELELEAEKPNTQWRKGDSGRRRAHELRALWAGIKERKLVEDRKKASMMLPVGSLRAGMKQAAEFIEKEMKGRDLDSVHKIMRYFCYTKPKEKKEKAAAAARAQSGDEEGSPAAMEEEAEVDT